MMDYVRELPDDVELSPYLKERSNGYLRVQHSGKSYYIPLTKEMKKVFKISRKKDTLMFGKTETQFSDMVSVIIDAVYLQVRDTVGSEVKSSIMDEIKNRIDNLLAPKLGKEIDDRLNRKLLPGEENKYENT